MKVSQELLLLEKLGLTSAEERKEIEAAVKGRGSIHLRVLRSWLRGGHVPKQFMEYLEKCIDQLHLDYANQDTSPLVQMYGDWTDVCSVIEEDLALELPLVAICRELGKLEVMVALLWNARQKEGCVTEERFRAAVQALAKRFVAVSADRLLDLLDQPIGQKNCMLIREFREKWV